MNSYDDYDDNDRFRNPTAAYKPRPWGQEKGMEVPIRSKPEPTSKTKIPNKKNNINVNG